MSNVVKLDLPESAIDGAIKRVMTLTATGYLPPQLKADLDLLVSGAMCWDLMQKPKANAESANK